MTQYLGLSTGRAGHLFAGLLVACAAAAFVAALVRVWPFTVDDTYITLRYSRNLADGLGPTFNATGQRAEGYTSAIWMLLLSLPHLLQVPALGVAKVLGVLAALATTAVVAWWVRHETRDSGSAPLATAAAVAAYVTLGRTAVHAVSGMETAFYTCVLTALFLASVRAVEAPTGARYWRLVLLCLLCGLSRPEGNLAAGVLLLGVGALLPAPARPRLLQVAALGWALPLAAHEAWRLAYYGLPFPLPFYVKVSSPALLPGAPPVLAWLGDVLLRVGIPAALAVATAPRALWPALAAASALVLFLLLPEHLNGYDFRYLAPLDPLLSVLFGCGVARAMRSLPTAALRVATAAALAALACGIAVVEAPRSIRNRLGYAAGMAAAHERIGRDLARLGDGRVALSDAGAIPYLSRWWTLDLVGLNNVGIAVTGDRDPRTVLASEPDVIVLVSGSGERFATVDWNPWEQPLYDAAREQGFVTVSVRRFDVDYWLWVLARPSSAIGRALAITGSP